MSGPGAGPPGGSLLFETDRTAAAFCRSCCRAATVRLLRTGIVLGPAVGVDLYVQIIKEGRKEFKLRFIDLLDLSK